MNRITSDLLLLYTCVTTGAGTQLFILRAAAVGVSRPHASRFTAALLLIYYSFTTALLAQLVLLRAEAVGVSRPHQSRSRVFQGVPSGTQFTTQLY